jgi:ligand-binding sensor domain-containing protein/signal transduction histidine kinase
MKYLYILCVMLFLAPSCTRKKESKSSDDTTVRKEALAPVQVVTIEKLPDSLQPKTIVMDKVPKPVTLTVPTTKGSSYSITTSKGKVHKINLEPPVTKLLPVLLDENSKPIKDKAGNSFIMGDGGLSSFTNFTTENGLAMDNIFFSMLDKRGNIWFGTIGGGVSRYDGKSFTNFTSAQGLANNSVTSIAEDKSGNLWFGTEGGGVSRYDGKSFTNYTSAQGLANNNVHSIAEDKSGNLWFGTFGGGVSRLSRDGKSFTNLTTIQGLANNNVASMAEDKSGNLWIGTRGGGVSRLSQDGKSFTNFTTAQGLANNNVYSIAEDKSGDLWFGTFGGGVSHYDGKSFTNFTSAEGLAGNSVLSIAEDKSGNLWFGTNGGGVSRYDGKSFTSFTSAQGLAGNIVYGITEDKSGNLWFGTIGGGVSRYEGRSFTNFTSAQGLAGNLVFTIAGDKSGNLWFGTFRGGVSRYDGKSFTNFTSAQGLVNNNVYSILEDKSGNLWFGTHGGGVSRLSRDGKSFTNFTTAQGLANNNVYNIAEDNSGNLWFGTRGGGVSRLSRDGKSFTNFTSAQGLVNNKVFCITKDRSGNLWLGTLGGGVSRYDGKSFTNLTSAQGLGSNLVWCITEDNKGNLWFGTAEGLSFLNRDQVLKVGNITDKANNRDNNKNRIFKTFTTKDGLPDNFVTQVMQLPNGKMVVGTNLGIAFFNPASEQPDTFRRLSCIEIYNANSGYPVKDINTGQNCLYLDSKGMIWAGTGSEKMALVRFNPSALHADSTSPTLVIQKIKVNEQNICWYDLNPALSQKGQGDSLSFPANITEEVTTFGKTLTEEDRNNMRQRYGDIRFKSITKFYPVPEQLVLPYRHNNINIGFGAIEVDRPNMVSYRYMLEGYDKDWSPVLKETSATFGNISEGTYTFKVKAMGPNGVWCEPVTYIFKVLPPWYRTWWAYLMYTLVFSLAFWMFIKWWERNLRNEKNRLEKKVEERTTELNQSLELLKETQSQLVQQEKLASLGALTAGIAHEIKNPLNFVNNFAELNNELLQEMNEQIDKGNYEEVKAISKKIQLNDSRINEHGKRADGIVKSMLEHSRSGTAEKQPTDINRLCNEYLNLAYHGMRANVKDFNCTIERNFAENLPIINIVPQDISRVMLNLINNAFYAVKDKPGATLTLTTMATARCVIIRIKDNGTGIPEDVKQKIFEPFFTTKPAGSGTGLGLSLSFDIIKAHGGKIDVHTEEGKGTEFIISLPV